jgi:integrase
MATAYQNPSGEYQIQFKGLDGKRKSLWLGKVDEDFVEEFKLRVERLLKSLSDDRPLDTVTQSWLESLGPKFRQKLGGKGLIHEHPVVTLGQLCDYCIRQADDAAPRTVQKYVDTKANLLAFFGDRTIYQVTPGDADEFRRWLSKLGRRPKPGPLAETTVSKRVQQARSFFLAAVRKRWLQANPFDGVRVNAATPSDRLRYVDRDTIAKLMEAADPELRLLIGLARYIGLRTPSETTPLQWGWINWSEGHLRVLDSKRRKHPDKKWRFPPLFPEVQQLLWDAYNSPSADPTYIIKPNPVTDTALRNKLERLCLRCGIMPWPKIWQNLRSTRETELVDEGIPIHVVCQWIGNSPAIALKHYLQVSKEHSQRALGDTCTGLQRWAAIVRETSAKNLCTQQKSGVSKPSECVDDGDVFAASDDISYS